jgi:hypothetical protein
MAMTFKTAVEDNGLWRALWETTATPGTARRRSLRSSLGRRASSTAERETSTFHLRLTAVTARSTTSSAGLVDTRVNPGEAHLQQPVHPRCRYSTSDLPQG